MARIDAVEFTCGECGAVNRLPRDRVLHLKVSPQCGKCDAPLFRAFDRYFDDLDPSSYIHPLDKETLEALRRIPGVSTLLRQLIRHSFELATRIHHHANFVQVSKQQLPSLWEQFEYAARSLGIKQMPELYVYQDPVPQAYTFGVERYFVAISTGALELLDEDEVTCMLAHELGHVHADHVLYKSAARVFGSVASTIVQATLGVGSIVVYPIQLALLRWDRASELSSDRAALLVMKNPHIVMRTLMKVAGGSRRLSDELNIDAFIEQADHFGRLQDEGPLGRYIAIFQSLFRSHPFPIWRTKEVLDWVLTGNFMEILDGDYKTRALMAVKTCPSCGSENRVDAILCTSCGHALSKEPTDEEAREAAASVGGIGAIDETVKGAWRDVQGWYKRNFTVEDEDDDGPVMDGELGDNKGTNGQRRDDDDDRPSSP